MKKWALFGMVFLSLLFMVLPVQAAEADPAAGSRGKILFVPHDGRPISNRQTADVVRHLGYEVVVPPQELLGDRDHLGNPEALWDWVEQNAPQVDSAVVSADSLIYGSLVGSRKHGYTREQVLARAERFAELRQANPKLPLYVFGSIMRTPSCGANAGSEEPDYYMQYGDKIFRYTALSDRQDTNGLTEAEKKERAALEKAIPAEYLQDWLGRRVKNFAVNQRLLQLIKAGTFDYLILGKDDNAPLSQTHMESRQLAKYSEGLPPTRCQLMTGIDEMGMLLLTRAVNKLEHQKPFVFARYNEGVGAAAVPAYSDMPIGKSVQEAVTAAGGILVSRPDRASVVLLVNTNQDGRTFDIGSDDPESKAMTSTHLRAGMQYFADMVKEYLEAGYPVAIADVAFANGSDNALMAVLRNRGQLFKLRAYAGWNTATNSSGFVIGEGMLAERMTDDARDQLLLNRYLEDWGYQANVREVIMDQVDWLRGSGTYASMDAMRPGIEARATMFLRAFASINLPPFAGLQDLYLTFPWNRGFEADIRLGASAQGMKELTSAD